MPQQQELGFVHMSISHGLKPFERNRLIPMLHSYKELIHKKVETMYQSFCLLVNIDIDFFHIDPPNITTQIK